MSEFMRVFPLVLLVVVFGASSLAKISRAEAFRSFVASVRSLRIVPARWASATAGVVVAVEIVTVGLLLTPPWYPAGLALAATVLAVFAVVAVVTRRRGLAVPCNCFGPGRGGRRGAAAQGRPLGVPHAVRNALLAGVALGGLLGAEVGGGWAGTAWVGAGLAGTAALVCAAVVLRFEDIVALFGQAPSVPRSVEPVRGRRSESSRRPSPGTAR
ncbi:MauE/DoxX family redox-associated membrane protein [Nonomuraea sp. NPDC000554]|uniref:MauE/DoxX family redox-associated membrane protein n=1 Tax=Nonomuraea sp. NPDC000554 TaxID=3154259 RepID=UPI003322E682